jgi:uncharacterized protein YigE (DUF2233 family)
MNSQHPALSKARARIDDMSAEPAVRRRMCAAAIFVLAALASGAASAFAVSPWRSVARGVEHLHFADADGEVFRFDLQLFDVGVVVPGAARPMTAAQVRQQRKAVLAINGGFFDTDGRSLGLRIAGGKTIIGLRPRVDWGILLVRPGQAAIVHSRDYVPAPEISAAVQVGPRVVIAGQVPRLKPQSSRRTAVAVDRSGRYLTVLATRARISAEALGAALARLGCEQALLLDGGPSTQLSAAVGDLALEVPGGYPVPDVLFIVPRGP